MSAKLRVHGRPQTNTKRKLARYVKAVVEERKADEKADETPPSRYVRKLRWRNNERAVHEMGEGCQGW